MLFIMTLQQFFVGTKYLICSMVCEIDMKSQDKSVNEALFESKNSHDNYQCVSYFDIAKYTASVRVQSTRRHFMMKTVLFLRYCWPLGGILQCM